MADQWQSTADHTAPTTPPAGGQAAGGWESTADHSVTPTPPTSNLVDDPSIQYLYTTQEGIPVYGKGPKPISVPLYPGGPGPHTPETAIKPQGLDTPLSTTAKILTAPLAYEKAGMEQLGQGLQGITHPQSGEQMAGAASDVIRGGMQTATPFFLPEAAANPLAAMTGLGTFGGAQAGIEWTARKLGLPEGYARLAGDIGGLYGGTKAHNWLADMAKIPDQRIADDIYRRLETAVYSLKNPDLDPNQRAAVKAAADSLLQSLRQEEGIPLIPRLFPNPNPMERSAYDYMRNQVGATPSAAAATGNPLVRGGQWLTGVTPAGAVMDQAARASNLEAIRGHARQLVQQHLPEEPSRTFYQDFEDRVNSSAPQNVPLSVDRDGSQIMGNVKAPVDIRDLKYEMQPLFDKMQFMPMADRSASAAYSTLDALLKSPDHVPAPTAEWGLGQFKAAARQEPGGVSEGLVKRVIPQLQALIDNSVRTYAGDDALTSLQNGRVAAAKEAGADWLSQRFARAQAAGGFDKERVLWNEWAKLPDTAKRSMFRPEQINELNNFFLGLRQYAENPNPSGSALVGALMGQGYEALHGGVVEPTFWLAQLGSAGMAKLLRSDLGVKLLTEGLRVPRTSERGQLIAEQLKQLVGQEPGQGPPPGAAPPPPGGPPAGPQAPGGAPAGPQAPPAQTPPPQAPAPQAGGVGALRGALGRAAQGVAAAKAKLTGQQPAALTPVEPEPGVLEAYPERVAAPEPTPPGGSPGEPAQAPPAAPAPTNLYGQAVQFVREGGQATTSALQRRFRLGYGAATRLIDQMRASGDLGQAGAPPPGSAGRAALQQGLERQQAATEANKGKLTVTPEEPASVAPGEATGSPGFLERLNQAGTEATQRLRDRGIIGGSQVSANAFLDPTVIRDFALSIAGDVASGAIEFRQWSKNMAAVYGPEVSKHLKTIWSTAQEFGKANQRAGWSPGMLLQDIDTSEGGRVVVPKLGKQLRVPDVARHVDVQTRNQLGSIPASASANAKLERLQSLGSREMGDQMTQKRSGAGWYKEDTRIADQGAQQAFPELKDPDMLAYQKVLSAVISSAQDPASEAYQSMRLWNEYRGKGPIPLTQPNGAAWPGRGATVQLIKVQRMVDKMGGVKPFIDFLSDWHTVGELKKYNSNVGGAASDLVPGSLVLGPKFGRYWRGIAGLPSGEGAETAVDLWDSRGQYRRLGRLIGKEGSITETPTPESERPLFMQMHGDLARDFNLEPEDAQSVLWHYEQDLYRRLGLNVKSAARSEGVRRFLAEQPVVTRVNGRVRP